jgi:hypothetical protein
MKIPMRMLAATLPGLLVLAAAHAADVTGQWRAEFDTQIGLQKYLYTLQLEGHKLTGKANAEIGDQKREVELKEGKLAGDTVTFVEILKFQDNSYLKEKNVPHIWHVDGNAHDSPEWRNNLYLFAQRLFR